MSHSPTPAPAGPSIGALGLRRVRWVCVDLEGSHPRATVVGHSHRLPTVVDVPLRVAAALAADGVPVVLRGETARGGGR